MTLVVGFAGMTHLGIVSAAAAAAKGLRSVGYDSDAGLVDRLRRRDFPISEPGLEALCREHAARLEFTADAGALSACDVVYLSTDVPTDGDGKSDLRPISMLVERLAPVLRNIFVVLCQVPPGFTRGIGSISRDRLFYQVETLVFGRAVQRAVTPERFIVGCEAPERPLPDSYRHVLETFECPILPMRYESAELAKISINICLAASVSVANTLAEMSETVGADWNEIVPALRLDGRIGPSAYLSPGLGIAGGNIERDMRTVLDLAKSRGTDDGVVASFLGNSRRRKDWCWHRLEPILARQPDATVAILGLAYKENTNSTKNAASLTLLAKLKGKSVRVHDPVVLPAAAPFAEFRPDALDCARGADVLVLATPWPEYRGLDIAELARTMPGRVLIDPYRLLDGRKAQSQGFEYHALGMPALMPAR